MRNPILAIAIVFVLAAPCTALAGEKKKWIEITSHQFGVSRGAPTAGVEKGTTSPALQGNALGAGAPSSKAGTIKMSPEYTRTR
jgi:hypothetical protein